VPGLPLDRALAWAADSTFLLASLVPLLREWYPETEFLACRAEVVESGPRQAILRVELDGEGPEAGTLFVRLGPRPSRNGLRRLQLLAETTAGDASALGLPRALGPLPSLRAAVVESRTWPSPPLGPAVAADEEAADRLARALDRLGRSAVHAGPPRTAASTVASMLRHVPRGRRDGAVRAAGAPHQARALAERAAAAIARRHRPGRPAVLLDGLSLSRLVDDRGRPTALAAWRAEWGDPLMQAGRLVAELEAQPLADPPPPAVSFALAGALANRLGLDPIALAAAAALQLAAPGSPDPERADRLLARAAALMAAEG
jgi:hypothetical protein